MSWVEVLGVSYDALSMAGQKAWAYDQTAFRQSSLFVRARYDTQALKKASVIVSSMQPVARLHCDDHYNQNTIIRWQEDVQDRMAGVSHQKIGQYATFFLPCHVRILQILQPETSWWPQFGSPGKTVPLGRSEFFALYWQENWWERAGQQFPSRNLWKMLTLGDIHTLGSSGRLEHAECP